jgi:hypothetical protein
MQEQCFFVFGRGGQLFSGGFEKIPGGGRNFAGGGPRPDLTPPIVRRGVLSVRQIIGDHVERSMIAHHFSHYYNWRCQQLLFELVGVINLRGKNLSQGCGAMFWYLATTTVSNYLNLCTKVAHGCHSRRGDHIHYFT